MNHVIRNSLLMIFMIMTLFLFMTHTAELVRTVHFSLELWLTRVFPVLFPFYILINLFIHYGITHYIGNLVSPITTRLFRLKSLSGFVLVMAMLSGNPQSAVMVSELYKKKQLDQNEAKHLMKFSSFANPLFIMGTVGMGYFHSPYIGLIILLSHISSNLIIGLLLRFYLPLLSKDANNPTNPVHSKPLAIPFGEVLTGILQKGINLMFLICGFIIFFNLLILLFEETRVLDGLYYLFTFGHHLNISKTIFSGFLIGLIEMVRGIDTLTQARIPLQLKIALITSLISFGGLSIHAQVHSILEDIHIPYRPFLCYRLMQMVISGTIAYALYALIKPKERPIETGHWLYQLHHVHLLFMIAFLFILLITYRLALKQARLNGRQSFTKG